MRSFGDRKEDKKERWDEPVPPIPVGRKGVCARLIGPLQDVAVYWVFPNAQEYVQAIRKEKKRCIRRGVRFKDLRTPRGFPVLCPRFDMLTEKFVAWRCPRTGRGFTADKTLTAAALKAKGVRVPRDLNKKTARFHPLSLKKKKAISLVAVTDPLKEDFNMNAKIRTWWYAIDREAQEDGKKLTRCIGVMGKGGIPITAYRGIKKIADAQGRSPADPDRGYDLVFTMNAKAKNPSDMWGVVRGDDTPLTRKERALLGKYKLADGRVIDFTELMSLKAKRDKSLRGMKVVKKSALLPINELASVEFISGEELKETLVRCGYYDDDGNPWPELIQEDRRKKSGEWGDDDDDDDDEEEERAARRRRRKARARREREEEEEDRPRRRRKQTASSRGNKRDKKKPRKKTRTETGKKRRRKRTIDLSGVPF